jgi:hypothetical protein
MIAVFQGGKDLDLRRPIGQLRLYNNALDGVVKPFSPAARALLFS